MDRGAAGEEREGYVNPPVSAVLICQIYTVAILWQ